MAFDPPDGILDIGNATLRVGKLEVAETSGLNQGLQNIIKNDLLITENNESSPYTTNQKWGLKLPTTWVAEFEVKGHSGKYIDFNFYNENSASNAQGYNLTFKDTSLTLKYDGGNNLPITGDTVDSTLSPGDAGYGVATIPTIVGAYRKVNIFFERGVISVSIDGTRYLYHKESDGYNAVHGHPGVASRVVSATGSAFVNVFIEQDASNSAFKNLRIVNGRFISDKTSNIAFIGGNLGVGVNSPKETLDIRGNMHFNRVSNVSQISVDSNVVTEYTGPHDRPLRKYPEVALTSASDSGYVTSSSTTVGTYYTWKAFDNNLADDSSVWTTVDNIYDSNDDYAYNSNKSLGGVDGEWLKIKLPNKIKPSYARIYPRTYSPPIGNNQSPEDFKILASNDDSNWVELTSVVGWVTNATWGRWDISSETPYKYFAIVCTRTIGAATFGLAELEFYGYEEGSGSLDTTLKSVYNVPATTGTQLEVYYDAKDLTTMPSTVTDLAGEDQNGTPGTGVTVADGAFVFDGTANGKIVGTHNLSGTAPVNTCSAWFKKVSSTGNYSYISRFGTNATSSQIAISIDERSSTLNKLRFEIYGASTALESEITITENVWYHVAGVYSGGTWNTSNCKLYLNGVEISLTNSTNTTTTPSINDTTLVLGSDGNSNSWDLDGSIANFRLYSKVLNADQVKELYDYQKDYFLGSKSQVTLYKGHLGVGVTEPSGQLELAGDERLQQYPPGPLSNYETLIPGHGVFCAYDSSTVYSTAGWKAFAPFDNSVLYWAAGSGIYSTTSGAAGGVYNSAHASAKRLSPTTEFGEYLILELPYKIVLSKVYISARNSHSFKAPSNFTIYGSNNNSDWSTLLTVTGATPSQTGGNYYPGGSDSGTSTSIGDMTPYKYLAIVVSKAAGGSDIGDGTSSPGTIDAMMIANISYFGTPGPTTLDKGSLTLGRSLDVPRISRYDVDTETPRPEKLVLDFDTTVNSSPTDISGKGNNGTFNGTAQYSAADKAFTGFPSSSANYINGTLSGVSGAYAHTQSYWIKGVDATPRVAFTLGVETGSYSFANLYWYTGSGAGWVLNTDGAASATWVEAIQDNRWYHVVLTYDGGSSTSSWKFYLDGEYKIPTTMSASAALSLASNPEYRIGRNNATQWYNGMVSSPKVYSVALEPSEVKKLYRLGRTGRSMVISDTAVGIGKVPEAQLDVRGSGGFTGDLTVGGNMNNYQYWFRGNRNGQSTNGATAGSLLVIQYTGIAGSYTSAWTGSNKYTCPEAGVYMTHGNFMSFPNSGDTSYCWVEVRRYNSSGAQLDGGSANDMHTPYRDNAYQSWHFQQTHLCNKGDRLQIMYRAAAANAGLDIHPSWGNVNIYKIG